MEAYRCAYVYVRNVFAGCLREQVFVARFTYSL